MRIGKDRPLEESDITNLVYLQAIVIPTWFNHWHSGCIRRLHPLNGLPHSIMYKIDGKVETSVQKMEVKEKEIYKPWLCMKLEG